MSPEEAIQIITDEELYINNYNWFEDKEIDSYEVGIVFKNHRWSVYETEYKGNGIKFINNFYNKRDALNEFIKIMRNYKITTENRLNIIFNDDNLIQQGIQRKLKQWNECKDRVFSV